MSRSSCSVTVMPSTFDFVGCSWSMSRWAKMSGIFPAVHLGARLAHLGEVVRPPGLEREVVPVRRALVVAGVADERPRDHAPDRVLAGRISRAFLQPSYSSSSGIVSSCAAIWKTESADV